MYKISCVMKNIIEWILALFISMMICNTVCVFYHKPAGWIERHNAYTSSIWNPNSTIVFGTEGYGINKVDSNGYVNKELPLIENSYVLISGASHTQGLHVMPNERYSEILNRKLGYKAEYGVYNVSQDGQEFDEMISNFPALLEEFPNSRAIVFEIYRTDYKKYKFNYDQNGNIVQVHFNPDESGLNKKNRLSTLKKIGIRTKELLPVVNRIKEQLVQLNMEENVIYEKDTCSLNEFKMALATIKEEYDGEIYILYHPYFEYTKDGGIKIEQDSTLNIFRNCCEENDIVFVDSTREIISGFEVDHKVPYGFQNTQIGKGHLNSYGHQMIADILYGYLKGER
ncbi:MAG: hypothetical protein IJV15_14330 [Lachnospiraceae bacterium]|nr:hypothetical protein [Lachnospiraceae bacterium]